MIQVKVILADAAGNSIEVNREYTGELVGKDLNEIESLICKIKTETMAASELSLLELNQKESTKKSSYSL